MQTQSRIRVVLIVLVAIAVLALGTIPTAAQTVPPTARQAAASPQFAARLAHPATSLQRAPAHRRAGACSPVRGDAKVDLLPLDDGFYSNGPINGTTDAWTINFGFVTADSFPVSGGAVGGLFTFGAWLFPGDVLQTVEISITSAPFGGTIYSDQVVSFSQSGCSGNQYGFNVCTESGSLSGPTLSAGTYWLNLQNAVVNDGDPVYWDENSGPSMAEQNSVGTIPSEAFTIEEGGGNACMPEQSGSFKVIHDFNGTDGANPSGVAIDRAGNLYGPSQPTGGSGAVYKLAQTATGWLLTNLYHFTGGNDGNSPAGVIVGKNGILYGAAAGGAENSGLIFDLRPSATACTTALCSWSEKVLYDFTGPTDAAQGGGLVSDQAGNLYGVSYSGGAQQQGAVFELSPSIGSWVETILYSFTGSSDGGSPTDIIVGNDGTLYGTAEWGGAYGGGVVFHLTPSANGWSETVLYNLPVQLYFGTSPHALLQDSAGNLYGEYRYEAGPGNQYGEVYELSPSNGQWVFTELAHGNEDYDGSDLFTNLIMNTDGNLYGAGGGFSGCYNTTYHGYIFEVAQTNDGWQYSTPVSWDNTIFGTSGALARDAQGNLYGTTYDCGAHNRGTVWQFTP